MLLLEIEKQARKLSKSDMVRLVQDVAGWLGEQEPDIYPALNVPAIDDRVMTGKYDLDAMTDAADKLNAAKATTMPIRWDDSELTIIKV
ncbi:MAG: hypothetical protein GY801_23625 [bacterium]|nr:hypothetical protein [bacterium]